MKIRTRLMAVVVLTTLVALAGRGRAHPGHGSSEITGLLHYLTEPVHLLPLLAAFCLIMVLVSRRYRRRRQAKEQ